MATVVQRRQAEERRNIKSHCGHTVDTWGLRMKDNLEWLYLYDNYCNGTEWLQAVTVEYFSLCLWFWLLNELSGFPECVGKCYCKLSEQSETIK